MTDFRFEKKKSAIRLVPKVDVRSYPIKPERGRIAGVLASLAEWRVAEALDYLGIDFFYKWNVPDTIYTVDFYAMMGEWIPFDVNNWTGNYETSEHRIRKRMIEMKLEKKLQVIWDTEVETPDMAVSAVRRLMR